MKTFKLKGLEVVEDKDNDIERKEIELLDGLVINREENDGWLIEAYVSKKYKCYFETISEAKELMIQVKITREENDPAFFISEIVSINDIEDDTINILFAGRVVDHRKSRIEDMLKMIIHEGYQGESLLRKFKELI